MMKEHLCQFPSNANTPQTFCEHLQFRVVQQTLLITLLPEDFYAREQVSFGVSLKSNSFREEYVQPVDTDNEDMLVSRTTDKRAPSQIYQLKTST